MLVFVCHFLQFLTRLFLLRLFITHRRRSLAKVILRRADHEELRIRIVQELWLQRHPSEISEFLKYPNENNVNMRIFKSLHGRQLTMEGILDSLVIDQLVDQETWDSSTGRSNFRVLAGQSPPGHHPTRPEWSGYRRDGMPEVRR